MRRSIALFALLVLPTFLMTRAEGSLHRPRCRTVAAEHRIQRRLARHRSAGVPQQSLTPVMVSSPVQPAAAESKPAVLVTAPDRTASVPSHDTEVWPPAWGLFPAE